MIKLTPYLILIGSSIISFPVSAGDSIYEACSDDSHFCCEANGNVVKVVLPQDIFGDYSFQNAQTYCEKNYGANVSINTTDFETVNIETPDRREVAGEQFHDID